MRGAAEENESQFEIDLVRLVIMLSVHVRGEKKRSFKKDQSWGLPWRSSG